MTSARSLALVLLIVLAGGAAAGETPPPTAAIVLSPAECEVWARELSFAQSVADHDPAAFAAHIEPDAAFSAESPQPLRGRDAISRRWASLVEGKQLLLSWYPTRTTISGAADVASSSGPALYEDLAPGAQPRFRIGGFHSVWHRGADGVWRILFDDGIEPKAATDADVASFHAGRQVRCPPV